MPRRLPRAFYDRPTLDVARDLLGARLVRVENGRRIAGIITETEAYCGEADLGCHAKAGRTKRTDPLYGPPGHAYVYFTYGNHWMLCPVTRPEGQPEAVLVRAIHPTESIDRIAARRGQQPQAKWTDGPGKLTQALGIDGTLNRTDLTRRDAPLFIEQGVAIPDRLVTTTPRIGLYTVPEPWKSIPWRFLATLPVDFDLTRPAGQT
ncbi:MAG: DNA-3-methyladenine glycosylase [Anaerolineae bacterium]|nr:MAG: DNA-3-methyladenine glycosylase [Anaerolineae bacterium]